MTNTKPWYVPITHTDQCGIDKETNKLYASFSIFNINGNTEEHLVYVTADGVDESKLEINNLTIEFLHAKSYENITKAYNAELFEEIYNVAFDQFFKMIDEKDRAV